MGDNGKSAGLVLEVGEGLGGHVRTDERHVVADGELDRDIGAT